MEAPLAINIAVNPQAYEMLKGEDPAASISLFLLVRDDTRGIA